MHSIDGKNVEKHLRMEKQLSDVVRRGALPKSAKLNSLFIAHSVIFAFLFTYSVPKN